MAVIVIKRKNNGRKDLISKVRKGVALLNAWIWITAYRMLPGQHADCGGETGDDGAIGRHILHEVTVLQRAHQGF